MAAGFLDNLVTSLGGAKEGPDPNRLEGLLECARSGMAPDELQARTKSMRARLRRALAEREASAAPLRDQLHPGLNGIIERNLQSCQDLIELLADLSPPHYDDYQAAAAEFLETSRRLAEWSTPMCPGCGSAGPERKCPECRVERLIPDLEPTALEFEQGQVSPEVAAVHQAYTGVISGQADLATLVQTLQDVEFTFLEARTVAEADPDREPLQEQLATALEAIDRLLAVEQNRQARELNAGWAQLFRAAVAIQKLL
ncbi:MAG: hypothetical protein KF760_29650 [Candidatus Eremiobacteraeota bacterium]|nr:hypothetical protein [Candidatus Eremiobacteraeota bacterium]MCW5872589.1 hypothetical protein [Candidatus Eremiobacteraeota bacterium]